MSKQLRFALIGCGRISAKYIYHLIEDPIDNASLVGVCDIDASRARGIGERVSVPWYTSIEKMLHSLNDQVDVVAVLTPSGLHSQHVIEVARFQKSIIVEKPMALTPESADEMISACSHHGAPLFVVKQNRLNKPVALLKRAIQKGRFGKIALGTIRLRWCRTQDYYDQDAWRGTWEHDGGVFSNQASHHIDLLQWLLGPAISVYATGCRQLVDIESEDTGVAIIEFKSGAVGLIEATTATRPRDLEGSVSILGEFGTVEIGGFAVNRIKRWDFVHPEPSDKQVTTFDEHPLDVYGLGHRTYLENIVSTIVDAKPADVDGLEGRRSVELISAIYESIEKGVRIPLPSNGRHSRLGVPK